MSTNETGGCNTTSIAIDASVRQRWIQAVVIIGIAVLAAILILPAIQMQRAAARREQSRHHLKQMGLALGNYHETHDCFPAGGTFDASSRGYHGWAIQMWPFLDSAPLSSLVDFRQAWNTPHNSPCFHITVPLFLNPSLESPAPDAGFAISHYSANSHLMGANSFVRLSDVEDVSNMFAMGELGGDFVPWGCPYNWRPLLELTNTPRTYGSIEYHGGLFVMVDSSVRSISPDIAPAILAKLRGPDLADNAALDLQVVRPTSFPYPANARELPRISNHRPTE